MNGRSLVSFRAKYAICHFYFIDLQDKLLFVRLLLLLAIACIDLAKEGTRTTRLLDNKNEIRGTKSFYGRNNIDCYFNWSHVNMFRYIQT